MIIDANTLPPDHLLEAEVCIVGAGAAGLTLARELVGAPLRVVLLESGGLKFEHRTQLLYRAENRGRPYPALEFTRRRQFGGSTTTWFGRCRPLDEIDFEARAWVPDSGWPISRSELDPYYRRADAYCQIGPGGYKAAADPFASETIETKIFRFSPPTNFAHAYGDEIERAENIRTILHANAVHLGLYHEGGAVDHILCRTLTGRSFKVRARVFVLAASALENTRLLLVSRDVHPRGVGNQEDLVGRFFMEHPHVFSGRVVSTDQSIPAGYRKLDYKLKQVNLEEVRALGPTPEIMRKDGLLNAGAFFVRRPYHKAIDAYFANGSAAALRIMEVIQHSDSLRRAVVKDLLKTARHADTVARLLGAALFAGLTRKSAYTLRLQLETTPNFESRVTLSDRRDTLGVPGLALTWKTSGADVESHRRFETHLYAALQRTGIQVRRFAHDLTGDGWPVSMRSAKHHMGTTRMHADARRGVVDAHCRVHSIANLYVAGSSVFPTSGMANPTLTIVALAIRLADHLKKEVQV